jgi:hypothetical protein
LHRNENGAEQGQWSECGRAARLSLFGTVGRPHRSLFSLSIVERASTKIVSTGAASRITAVQVPPEQWIRGDYQPIANLRSTAAELGQRLNAQFMEDVEDGLGPFRAAGFETPSGRRFGLTQYLKFSGGPSVEVTCLHDKHFATDLDEVLESLDMDLSDLFSYGSGPRFSSEVRLVPHALWRQDDNGVLSLVKVFPCRANASKIMRAFEAAGHKQAYWVKPYDA